MDIFDREPALASDAEWLLQSGDASVESLAEVLTDEYYPFIFQLALLLKGEYSAARNSAIKALAQAIRQASHYSAQISVRAWLAGFCIRACKPTKKGSEQPGDEMEHQFWQAINGLSQSERITFILKAFLELPLAEIASISRQENSVLEQSLRSIYDRIQVELQPALPDVTPGQIDQYLKEASNRRWTQIEFSEQDLQSTSQQVARLVSRQLSVQKRRSVILATVDICLALLIFIVVMQTADRVLPTVPVLPTSAPAAIIPWSPKVFYQVQPGDSLESIAKKTGMTPAELSSMNAISSTRDLYEGLELAISVPGVDELSGELHFPVVTPAIAPLAASASPAEIRNMLVTSGQFWRTLWLDTQEATGSLEPTMTNGMVYIRRQVWIQQPNLSYEITNYLWGSNQMDYYRAIILNGQGYYTFGSYSYFFWDTDWRLPAGEVLYNPFLDDMVLPGKSDLVAADRQYQALGESQIAGRKVLIVDTRRSGDEFQRRIWIDEQTGVILRYQVKFPDQNGQKDFIVTEIAFNIPIPPTIFDPRQPKSGGFAIDYSGWAPAPDSSRATETPAFSVTPPATLSNP